MFSDSDLKQIVLHGLDADKAERQMRNFRNGFPPLNVVRAAVAGDGIVRLSEGAAEEYSALYDSLVRSKRVEKFVPASGAATRMFKELYGLLSDGRETEIIREVIENIDGFAFGEEVKRIAQGRSARDIVSAVISETGLDYGRSPKALILFHKYGDGNRTAMEEHLAEGAMYARSDDGTVNIHFTVSAEHMAAFKTLAEKVLPKYEALYGVKYGISYSQQKPSTDTLAATPDNEPFREEDGTLLFRPAGHGALLENLGEIDADVIFVKTVDNVAPDSLKKDTVLYKKSIGGYMLSLQEQVFRYLEQLDGGNTDPEQIARFIETELAYKLPASFKGFSREDKTGVLREILDRPIRVCGMVKNEGEPGGGPFWVADKDGGETLQIGESAQIADGRKHLLSEGTHFNPVDIVCGTRDHKGVRFDLSRFVDHDTGFISVKSKDGRELKAQELPGFWNGSMAKWNTVFIEVPVSTFSPVKTVNDLLRREHQGINN